MGRTQGGKLPVDLDQSHQQRRSRHRPALVRGARQLVEVVPQPRQLPQQIRIDLRGFASLPQALPAEGGAHQFRQRNPLILSNSLPLLLFLRCRSDLDPQGKKPLMGVQGRCPCRGSGAGPFRLSGLGGLKGAKGPLTSAKDGHAVSGQEYACVVSNR